MAATLVGGCGLGNAASRPLTWVCESNVQSSCRENASAHQGIAERDDPFGRRCEVLEHMSVVRGANSRELSNDLSSVA